MTKEQKEVQQAHLDEEKKVIRQLKQVYSRAAKDCEEKIAALNARTDMQNLQSIIYQKQYQQALKSQIDGILTTLQTNEFSSISEYLTASYTNGFVGAMYDLTAQGIPVISPIKQQNVVKAIQTDSKISTTLYKKLGEDVTYLKKSIRAELSRGTANGSTWTEIASHIANGMNSPLKTAMNRAILIARTEGHRIQQESQLDALHDAQDNGADVVKQWDATLDSRTRPDHRAADGQIRELDDKFRVGGESMTAPGVGGSARNVCNCRCCLLQRARWALDEDELKTLKTRASFFGLDKTKDFDDFRQKYLKATSATATIDVSDLVKGTSQLKAIMSDADYEAYQKLLSENTDQAVAYLYANYADGISKLQKGSGYYQPGTNLISFDYVADSYVQSGRSRYSTLAHEYGHYFDAKVSYDGLEFTELQAIYDNTTFGSAFFKKVASSSDQFLAAVRADRAHLQTTLNSQGISDLMGDASAGVQDAVDGLLGQRINWGHGDKYYNRKYNSVKSMGDQKGLQAAYKSLGMSSGKSQAKTKTECRVYESASEIWANVMSAETCGGKELEYVKKYLPNSYQALQDIIGKAVK